MTQGDFREPGCFTEAMAEVADQPVLIRDLQDTDQAMAAQGHQPVVGIPVEEQVPGEERHHRSSPPTLGGLALAEDLRQIIHDSVLPQLAGGRLLLTRLGVHAPPGPIRLERGRGGIVPEVRGVTIGFSGENRHRGQPVLSRRDVHEVEMSHFTRVRSGPGSDSPRPTPWDHAERLGPHLAHFEVARRLAPDGPLTPSMVSASSRPTPLGLTGNMAPPPGDGAEAGPA